MKKLKKPEVLVAGAGPVGMITALCLLREGLSVQIVERASAPATHSCALALHPASLELLDELGVAQPLLDQALKIESLGLYDGGDRRAGLSYRDLERKYPFLAVVQQDVLEHQLSAALHRADADILWNHRLARLEQTGDGVDVEVEELEDRYTGYAFAHMERMVAKRRKLRVPFLVGADGHGSVVRLQADWRFEETGKAEDYAVFEFDSEAAPADEMRLGLMRGKMNVFWPLPRGRRRWSFQLNDDAVSAYSREKDRMLAHIEGGGYPLLDTAHLHGLIRERAPWFDDGSVGTMRWRIGVRFEKRLAQRFGEDRIWLVGDAAHMAAPAGIQSMNSGFREGDQLAKALAAATAGGNPDKLNRFDAAFRGEWRVLQGLDPAVKTSAGTDPWLAENAGRLLSSIPATGRDLRMLARQLGFDCPDPEESG